MKILSAINENDDIVRKKYVDDGLGSKQPTLISGTNIKTIDGNNILGSGNLEIITSDIEQKNAYILEGITYYYQFYGTSSLDGIIVNIGYEVDVVLATLALINETIEELARDYAVTLAAIQNIHIPDTVYESPVLIINIHNLGCMTCHINSDTKYVESAVFTNFEQGYSVNFGADPNNLTIYYSASDKVESKNITNIVTCTSTEYDSLSKDSSTLYLITD